MAIGIQANPISNQEVTFTFTSTEPIPSEGLVVSIDSEVANAIGQSQQTITENGSTISSTNRSISSSNGSFEGFNDDNSGFDFRLLNENATLTLAIDNDTVANNPDLTFALTDNNQFEIDPQNASVNLASLNAEEQTITLPVEASGAQGDLPQGIEPVPDDLALALEETLENASTATTTDPTAETELDDLFATTTDPTAEGFDLEPFDVDDLTASDTNAPTPDGLDDLLSNLDGSQSGEPTLNDTLDPQQVNPLGSEPGTLDTAETQETGNPITDPLGTVGEPEPQGDGIVNTVFVTQADGETGVLFDTTPLGEGNNVSVKLAEDVLKSGTDAEFDNIIGLYEVVNESGAVQASTGEIFLPGDEGYAETAIRNRVNNFELRAGSSGDESRNTSADEFGDVILNGGRFYAPFVIANGGELGFEGFINQESAENNGFNNAAESITDVVAYFGFTEANPDGSQHLQMVGNNTFGFEDLPANLVGSDNDFNDAMFKFDFSVG